MIPAINRKADIPNSEIIAFRSLGINAGRK
jgi:hypothetical protein